MAKIVILKEDVKGTNPDNFIQNETIKTLTGKNRLLVPEYGAFYEHDFELIDSETNETLVYENDYYFTDLYQEATLKSGKSVWNTIVLKDNRNSKDYLVTYRAYGGPYSRNVRKLIAWLAEKQKDYIQPAEWSEIEDIPSKFVPAFHNHLLKDIYGFEYINNSLKRIENAITIGNSSVVKMLIDDVLVSIENLKQKTKDLTTLIIGGKVSDILGSVDKAYLGLDLIANLDVATYDDIRLAVDATTEAANFTYDRYINKKNLHDFSKLLKEAFVLVKDTNLGINEGVVADSNKAAVMATVNGAVITLDSIQSLKNNNIAYEPVVYPKGYSETDKFIITRVANHQDTKAGVWLGFNENTLDTYIGIMTGDECFRRIKWYRFYTDGSIEDLQSKVQEHINDTKDPHELTKEQVGLGLVENYPVVTEEEILAQEPVKKYVTMDTLMYFMAANLLNLKAVKDKNGEIKIPDEILDKANIIYMPCDAKPEVTCPPKDQLIKTFCDGTEKIGRFTDGACSFYDKVLQEDSDDCQFFDVPKQGTNLGEKCENNNKYAIIADGRGGKLDVLIEKNSNACGFVDPRSAGTMLHTKCVDGNEYTVYADGEGGKYEILTAVNSRKCGFPGANEGEIIAEFCSGTNKMRRYSDGAGGYLEVIFATNSEDCGGSAPEPATKGEKRIFGSSTPSVMNIGDTETITFKFSGFEPGQTVHYKGYISTPGLMGGQGVQVQEDSITMDSSGSATKTTNQTATADIFNIVPGSGNRLEFNNWIETTDGVRSNTFPRTFVRSGGGGSTPSPAPAPAPSNLRITGTVHNTGNMPSTSIWSLQITGGNMGDTVRVQGERPNGTIFWRGSRGLGKNGVQGYQGYFSNATGVEFQEGTPLTFRLTDYPSEFVVLRAVKGPNGGTKPPSNWVFIVSIDDSN